MSEFSYKHGVIVIGVLRACFVFCERQALKLNKRARQAAVSASKKAFEKGFTLDEAINVAG